MAISRRARLTLELMLTACSLRAYGIRTAVVAAPRWHRASTDTAALVAAGLLLVLAACGTGTAPAPSDVARAPGTVELNQAPPDDIPPGGGGPAPYSSMATSIASPLAASVSRAVPSQSSRHRVKSTDLRKSLVSRETIAGRPVHQSSAGKAAACGCRTSMQQSCISRIRHRAACRTSATMPYASSSISDLAGQLL